jgi:dienelactone hydrolase
MPNALRWSFPMHVRLSRFFLAIVLIQATALALADGTDRRSAFLRVIDRPSVALAPESKTLSNSSGLENVHFTYAADARQRVPGLLWKEPGNTRRPAVIVMHGTGGSKQGPEIVSLCERLAHRGFVCVAIDGRYHGERTANGSGTEEYNKAIEHAWLTGKEHPFYYDTVWDIMRLIDYLETRPDIDAKRIGLTGISKGGIETYFAAALDTRVAAAVPLIGVQSFKWALDNGQWKARIATIQSAFDAAAQDAGKSTSDVEFVRTFYDRVVPGIYGEFDGPTMLPLIAPRPLLVINSDSDANTPIAGVRLAVEAAKPAYAAANAAGSLVLTVQESTGHKVNPESFDATIEWFVRWLKP